MQIQFTLPEYLTNELREIKIKLQHIEDNFRPKEQTVYLSRADVAELLKIDISSVHNWTKKGILQPYQIGGKIFYKRSEIEAAIVKLNK